MEALRGILRRARLRFIAGSAVDAGLRSVAAAFALMLLAAFARLAGVLPQGTIEVAALAAAVMALAFVVLFGRCLARLPTLSALATRSDRRYGLHDRLSTAMELDSRPRDGLTLVERAAIEDAERYVERVHAATVVPIRWPRWGWLVPVLAGSAAAATLFVAPPGVATSTTEQVEQEIEHRGEVATAAVKALAEALAQDQVAAEDPYLRAVARELESFAAGLDGAELDDAQRTQLDRLLEHLARAAAGRADRVGSLLHELAESGLRSESDGRADSPDQPDPDLDVAAVSIPQESGGIPGDPKAGSSVSKMLDDLATAVADVAAADGSGDPVAAGPDGQECDAELLIYGGVCTEASLPQSGRSGMTADGDAAGNPTGAATAADDSPGDAAGRGEQPEHLADGTDEPLADDSVEFTDLALPDERSDSEGAHFETEAIPAAAADGAATITGVGRLAEHRADEGAMPSSPARSRYDRVVRQYFLPAAANGQAASGSRAR